MVGRPSGHFFDDAALVVHDALHQFGVCAIAHGLVAVAAHADGNNVVGATHALNAFAEETVQVVLVGLIVPWTPFLALAGVLLVVAGHGLVVTGAHDDPHLVGQG